MSFAYSNGQEGWKRSHYGLLFLHDKSKRNKSKELVPYLIPQCFFCYKTNSLWPRPSEPDANMEYSSNSEHSDMIVVVGDDTYKPEEDDQAELNNLTWDLNLSKESAQLLGSCLRETSVSPRNNVQLVLKPWKRISYSRISHHWFIATTLLDWSMLRNRDFFFWLIQQKSQSISST